ncbi:hypothetical protein CASFOL_017755 [Castilleja foliolosa]|uniref:Splicing factor Cactin C-terminal domain-containing protein n=1 Tax=Castilleja foliolosa TaxID=1961234 RepID=A0ABD3D952_9LAMI
MPSNRRRAIASDDEIAAYLHKKATRFSQKLKKKQSTYDKFLWIKKVTRDVLQLQSGGGLDHYFSLEAELEKQRQRQSEIQRLRDRKIKIRTLRERKPEEKARTSHNSEPDRDNYKPLKVKAQIDCQATPVMEDAGGVHEKDDDDSEDHQARKPKFVTRVHTGYEWSKYNRTHYDRENPPPKFVQGYKFEVWYPDLADKSKPPTYDILRDGESVETCIIRFRAGPPYQDIAFRIVNSDWDYSRKNGFKSTFERGVLRVYFNFKRYGYRR